MQPKVTVIIPVYNAEKYLRKCLDSVVNQSLREIEIICVDDGSTDSSPEILAEYAEYDERILIITQENSGAGNARNVGLEAASGEYLLFLDSDDWFERDYFDSAVDKIEADYADICICGYESFDNLTGKKLASNWEKKSKNLPQESFSPNAYAESIFQLTDGQVWDKLYRCSFIKQNGIKFPCIKAAEDTAFSYQTLLLAECITVLPRVMVHYRINRFGSVSKSFTENQSAPFDAFEIIYKFLLGKKLMPKYEQSFLMWAMEYLVWQVNNMPDKMIQKKYLLTLKNTWFPILYFEQKRVQNFVSREVYAKYFLMKNIPCSLYIFLINRFKQLKQLRSDFY